MRRFAAVLSLAVVCGCGGGGGESATSTTPVETTPVPVRTLEEILSDCVTPDLQEGVEFLESVARLAEGGTVPGLALTGFDFFALRFSFALDANLDGAPEATGTFRFLDAAGRAILPFDVGAALAGTLDLATAMASLPDGTRFVVTWTLLAFVDGGGVLDVGFLGGLPQRAKGELTLADGPCDSKLTFTDLLLPSAPDAYPTGVLLLVTQSGPDRVEGTLTLDGTATAHVSARVNGGPPEEAAIPLS